jgi:hypothetical protein
VVTVAVSGAPTTVQLPWTSRPAETPALFVGALVVEPLPPAEQLVLAGRAVDEEDELVPRFMFEQPVNNSAPDSTNAGADKPRNMCKLLDVRF